MFFYLKNSLYSLCVVAANRLWYTEFPAGLIYSSCFLSPCGRRSDSFHNKYIMLIKTKTKISVSDGCTLSVRIQAGHSLVYQLWGECSGWMINCYSTDYINRPSICLTPSPPHPQKHFPLYSTYLSLCVSQPTHPCVPSLWPTNPFTQTVSLSEIVSVATSPPLCFISMSARRKAIAKRVIEKGENALTALARKQQFLL